MAGGHFGRIRILLTRYTSPALAAAGQYHGVRLLVRDIAKPTPAPQLHPSAALLLLWLPFAAWLFLRPHEFVIGGGDAGVYVNLAANINKTGSIVFYDQAVAELDPALHDALLYRLPQPTGANHTYQAGFATDLAQGEITPQFYPLHPAWQAVAYTRRPRRGAADDRDVGASEQLRHLSDSPRSV